MLRVTDSAWFTETNTTNYIGIIIAKNEQGSESAYIGTITDGGGSRMQDAYKIANTGSKFPLKEAKSIVENRKRNRGKAA